MEKEKIYYKVLGFWNDGFIVKRIFDNYMMAHREYLLLKENNIYCNGGLKELSMDDSNGKIIHIYYGWTSCHFEPFSNK